MALTIYFLYKTQYFIYFRLTIVEPQGWGESILSFGFVVCEVLKRVYGYLKQWKIQTIRLYCEQCNMFEWYVRVFFFFKHSNRDCCYCVVLSLSLCYHCVNVSDNVVQTKFTPKRRKKKERESEKSEKFASVIVLFIVVHERRREAK